VSKTRKGEAEAAVQEAQNRAMARGDMRAAAPREGGRRSSCIGQDRRSRRWPTIVRKTEFCFTEATEDTEKNIPPQ
jgi:hypothetical protein